VIELATLGVLLFAMGIVLMGANEIGIRYRLPLFPVLYILDRAAVVLARRDVSRDSRNTVDSIWGCFLAVPVVAPANDVARACLDRAVGRSQIWRIRLR
jgi:hypothetical protein